MGTAFRMLNDKIGFVAAVCSRTQYPHFTSSGTRRASRTKMTCKNLPCSQSNIRHSDNSIPRVSGRSKTLKPISM
jgi:hypothetical protein